MFELTFLTDLFHETFLLTIQAILGALAGVLTLVAVKYLKKIGLQIDAEEEAKILLEFRNLILRVEEWAHGETKDGRPVTSSMKRAKLHDLATAAGFLPSVVIKLRDQELPKVRGLMDPQPPAATEP